MNYVARRIAVALLTMAGSIVLVFILVQLMPGDPAMALLGPHATPQLIEGLRNRMGLNDPVYVAIPRFLYSIAKLDFGIDPVTYRPVAEFIGRALPYSVILAFTGLGLALIVGIPLGCFSATHQDSIFDLLTKGITTLAITVPPFLMAIFLLLGLALPIQWLPIVGGGESGSTLDQFRHLILPAIALALVWVGYIARFVRSLLLEVLREDYIRTARAVGLRELVVVYKHGLRNAITPLISLIGVGFGNLLGGELFVEIVFNRPGVGRLIYDAVLVRNFVLMEYSLFTIVALYVLVNALADVSYHFLDPRIRRD